MSLPAQEATIGQLAENVASRHNEKKKWIPAIPFFAVMLIFTTTVFALAIIPTCVQVFSSANGSIENLSQQIMKGVILNLGNQLQQMMGSARSTFETFNNIKVVKDTFTNTSEGLGENMELIQTSFVLLEKSPILVNLICTQNYNATGRAPLTGKPVVFISASMYGNRYGHCDYRNLTHCFIKGYYPSTNTLTPDEISNVSPESMQYSFIYQKMSFCGSEGTWRPETFQGLGWMSYAVCAPINKNGFIPYSCGGVFITAQILNMMKVLAPTQNSRIWITTVDGDIFGSNMNETQYPLTVQIAPNLAEFAKVSTFKEEKIQELSMKLMQGKSAWKDIQTFDIKNIQAISSNDTLPTTEYILSDGKKWITIALALTFGTPEKFYLVVSIPRNDFFELVDNSIRTGITLSSVFSGLGVIAGIVVTILVVIPMQRLTNNMKLVTKFDFSMLQSGALSEDSVFTEVQHMQKTFNLMVKAFAGAIQVNKNLAAGNSLQSSTGKKTQI